MAKILQINLGRRYAAHDLLLQVVNDKKIDVIIISEPNRNIVKKTNWYTDEKLDVAIGVMSTGRKVNDSGCGNGFIWIEYLEMIIYSCYISPNVSEETFVRFLYHLKQSIRSQKKECLIGGDFNAKSMMWGSPINDSRGEILSEWASELDLVTLNNGVTPTFRRGESTSFIDVTFVTSKLATKEMNWKVSDEENLSDHNYIFFDVENKKNDNNFRPWNTINLHMGWKVEQAKLEAFGGRIKQKIREMENNNFTPESFIKLISCTCDGTFKIKRKPDNRRKPVYWWSAEIANIRRECHAKKRIMTRKNKEMNATADEVSEARNQYKEKRTCLKKAILKAKKDAWESVLEKVENDVWGTGYKIVTKSLHLRPPIQLSDEATSKEAEKLFPKHEKVNWEHMPVEEQDIPLFSAEELSSATSRIKPKKAPGPDHIPPEVIQYTAKILPDECLSIMNKQLKKGEFPQVWKKSRLVLLEKPRKEPQHVPTYRPLCLLDTMGKLFEHLLKNRLNAEIERTGGLAQTQYGFTKGKSTVDAINKVMLEAKHAKNFAWQNRKLCLLVTLDVKNAFNSAPWQGIVSALIRRNIAPYLVRMIASYFTDRELLVGDNNKMEVTCGVPQGSVLGPLLWNLYYDDVLRLEMPQEAKLVGYADDLAVVVTGKTEETIITAANIAIHRITECMKKLQLQLSPEKTEAVLLANKKTAGQVFVNVQETEIGTKPEIKYLGVTMDQGATMKKHVTNTCKKAEASAMALSRLMPALTGPSSMRRKLLSAVTHSIMLYAVPVWYEVFRYKKYKNMLLKIQRKLAIRICSAFRTVSTEALFVLSGVTPIDLQARERSKGYGKDKATKLEEKENSLNDWQQRWSETNNGTWTRTLIPDIHPWIKRKHGSLNYYLTQLFTGHGCFMSYFHRFKIRDTPACCYCKSTQDDAEHTFFYCPRWQEERRSTEEDLGEHLRSNNIVELMLKSKQTWSRIADMITKILKVKEEDQKRRTD